MELTQFNIIFKKRKKERKLEYEC